jgi:hypothetical protein
MPSDIVAVRSASGPPGHGGDRRLEKKARAGIDIGMTDPSVTAALNGNEKELR